MLAFFTLFIKEWQHHRWRILALFAIGLLAISFIGMEMGKMVDFLPGGVLSVVMYFWQVFGVLIVASTLANGVVISDYKSRTQEFLEGLPVKRWMNLTVKFLFVFIAVTIISSLLFLVFAARSSQFGVRGWEAIAFPLLRMASLNFAISAAAFLVALLGKFRWYLYLAIGAVIMLGAAGFYTLGSNLLPFRILEAEQTMGEFDRFPWDDFLKNALIGLAGLLLSITVAYLFRGKMQSGVANRLSMRDWMIFLMVFSALMLLIGGIAMKEGQEDIDYKLDYGSVGESTSGETLVRLNLQEEADDPFAEKETEADIAALAGVAATLEDARATLTPPWWPASWVIIRDGTVGHARKDWTTAVSGDSFVLIANWDEEEGAKTHPNRWRDMCHLMLQSLFWEMTYGETHRDRYGWIHDGLALHFIERNYPGFIVDQRANKARAPALERLTEESLAGWFLFTKQRWKLSQTGSVALLAEVESRLGREGFAEWTRPLIARSFAKPPANTIYSLKRGLIYWKGIVGGDAIDYTGLGSPAELVEAAKARITVQTNDKKAEKKKKAAAKAKKAEEKKKAKAEQEEDSE